MSKYEQIQQQLKSAPRRWLVTGCAGFIGSNLLETLLKLDQDVVGLDNFSTGKQANFDEVESLVSPEQWSRFHFIEGDICDLETCRSALQLKLPTSTDEFPGASHQLKLPTSTGKIASVDFVLHQAALGSVPRSLEDPVRTNASNVTGFLNMLVAARDAGVKRFVYAASSSTYGDHPALPKVEDKIGRPLSPYAVTKYVNELYADVFARCYGVGSIGLRYFNVFGPRQDPEGAYAAVIPKWIAALLQNEPVFINGDGTNSRDFCYVANAVQANILAATTENSEAINQIYNVAVGDRTTLNELYEHLRSRMAISEFQSFSISASPHHRAPRAGDVAHSQADISKAQRLLGYDSTHSIADGLNQALPWYVSHNGAPSGIDPAIPA